MPGPSSDGAVTVIGPGGTRGPVPGAYEVPVGAVAGDTSSVENITWSGSYSSSSSSNSSSSSSSSLFGSDQCSSNSSSGNAVSAASGGSDRLATNAIDNTNGSITLSKPVAIALLVMNAFLVLAVLALGFVIFRRRSMEPNRARPFITDAGYQTVGSRSAPLAYSDEQQTEYLDRFDPPKH
ncbi:hypothetical protein K438DRAFT_1168002 [Mycena galopus ATCC 62051]|nr:hypothetical protein K438DRAFT_1168002 [Mycena galopus ATCC 62051]